MAYPASAQEEMTRDIKRLDKESADFRYQAESRRREADRLRLEADALDAKATLADNKRRQYELAVKVLDGDIEVPADKLPALQSL